MAGSRVPFQGHSHHRHLEYDSRHHLPRLRYEKPSCSPHPPADWELPSKPSEPPKTPTLEWSHSPPLGGIPGSPIPMSGAPAPSPPPCFSIASPQPMFALPASEYDFLSAPSCPAELEVDLPAENLPSTEPAVQPRGKVNAKKTEQRGVLRTCSLVCLARAGSSALHTTIAWYHCGTGPADDASMHLHWRSPAPP